MDPHSVKCQFNEGRIVNNCMFRASQSFFLGWVCGSELIVMARNRLDFFFCLASVASWAYLSYQADSYPVLNWTKTACKPNISSTSDFNPLSVSMLNTQGKEWYCFLNRISFLCKDWNLKLLWICRIWESVARVRLNGAINLKLWLGMQTEFLQSNLWNTNIQPL